MEQITLSLEEAKAFKIFVDEVFGDELPYGSTLGNAYQVLKDEIKQREQSLLLKTLDEVTNVNKDIEIIVINYQSNTEYTLEDLKTNLANAVSELVEINKKLQSM